MLLDTPVCDFGWQAPDFALTDPIGTPFTLKDVMGANGVLIAFICNHCPYVQAIIGRLVADAKTLQAEGFGVVAIMPNDFATYPDDAPDAMLEFASNHEFSFPYLVDEDQSIARAYGAVCTPDFFGFDKTGGLQYRGRLDDAKMKDATQRVPELLNALRQVAATGHGPEGQTPSMGCSIKWT
jgi:peroxiredoxin